MSLRWRSGVGIRRLADQCRHRGGREGGREGLNCTNFLLALQFLRGVVLSGSLVLLEVLISIMCREAKHTQEDQIQSSLQEFLTG